MGFLVDDEDTALMWRGLILAKALEQFLTDVRWGDLDYLLIDMPPGTGDIQMALARLLPQAEMLVVTTPAQRRAEGRGARRRHGAPLVPEGARRGREHDASSSRPTAARHAIFGEGGGAALAEDHRRAARRRGPDRARGVGGRRRTARPVVLDAPDTAAAPAFTAIAERIVAELLPPVEMAGCTARIFDLAKNLA